MASFTMPAQTYAAPSGTVDVDLGYGLVPASGTTLRASWTASGLVTFTGHFRNRTLNTLVGPQTFTNNSSGNWIWSADTHFDGSTPWGFELDSITANGHSITVTFSVDSGRAYSGRWTRRAGAWVFTPRYTRRSGVWVFTPRYTRRSGAWTLLH